MARSGWFAGTRVSGDISISIDVVDPLGAAFRYSKHSLAPHPRPLSLRERGVRPSQARCLSCRQERERTTQPKRCSCRCVGMRRDFCEHPITRGARVSREKHALARKLRREPTPSEQRAWVLLRNRRCFGLKFRRQQVIRGYIADFYCAELRLVLEIDGGVHDTIERFAYDLDRSMHLQEAGIWHELHIRPENVTEGELRRLLSRLLPLSREGEGAGG